MVFPVLFPALLPGRCAACGVVGGAPCASCWRTLKPAPSVAPSPGFAAMRSLLLYEGAARELIARLKYRNERGALPWLARGMAALVEDLETIDTALVTWAPTSRERQRKRGFDQAELLARAVARELHRPCRALLRRLPGPAQTGRHASERAAGVDFVARRRSRTLDLSLSVLLVDDVLTTGATLAAAANALTTVGITRVIGLTGARTPLKVPG